MPNDTDPPVEIVWTRPPDPDNPRPEPKPRPKPPVDELSSFMGELDELADDMDSTATAGPGEEMAARMAKLGGFTVRKLLGLP